MERRDFLRALAAAGLAPIGIAALENVKPVGDRAADPAVLAKVTSCTGHTCASPLHFTNGGGPGCPDRSICVGETCPDNFTCEVEHRCGPNSCGGGGTERTCAAGVFYIIEGFGPEATIDDVVLNDTTSRARHSLAALLDGLNDDLG